MMRLERIILHNYRIYGDLDLSFHKTNKDIQLIIGQNGVGKTTFLNSINWCLYETEPHAYASETLPILKLNASDDLVYVKLVVSTKNELITFTRKQEKGIKYPLTVEIKNKNGELQRFSDEENVLREVDAFVPEMIREFFFFDGEQLDNYFLNERTKNIKNQIILLSNIVIVDEMIYHLEKRIRSITRKAGKKNNNVDKIQEIIASKKNAVKDAKNQLDTLNKNKNKFTDEINKLSNELRGIRDTREIEKDRDNLRARIDNLEDNLSKNEKDRANFLVLKSIPILLNNAIFDLSDFIEDKKKRKELPADINEEVIHESLNNNVCKVCGRPLNQESKEYLNNSLANYKVSSELSKLLLDIRSFLKVYQKGISEYYGRYKVYVDNSKTQEGQLKQYKEDLKKINDQYGAKNEDIQLKFNNRDDLEKQKERCIEDIIRVEVKIKDLNNEILDLEDDLSKELEKSEITRVFNKKKRLCQDALDVLKSTKIEIMDDTRSKIENFTKHAFFDLLWKKETYSDVKISDNYTLELIHSKTNKNSLGSASAAERELLALAFTLGVHSVSGFDSPLLIDTPLARVSDNNRVNFADTLLKISESKQIILLLTPAEFSDDIKELFDKEDLAKFNINLSGDETSSIIK